MKLKNYITPDKVWKKDYYKEENGKIIISPDEKMFDTSYGTEPIMIRLEKLLLEGEEKVNTILFNMSTIIRNSFEKDLMIEENMKRIGSEMNLTIERIKDIYSGCPTISHPYLIIYMSNYRKDYEKSNLRPITPGRKMLQDIETMIFEKFSENVVKYGNLTVNFTKLHEIPYADSLQKLLKDISTVIPNAFYTGYYYLISHYPIDFHVMNKCPNGNLISSHTGELINRKQLNQKVFGNNVVPFNLLLHALFGDKYQLAPSVKPQMKGRILEVAEKNNWLIKTDNQIKKDLRNIGIFVE